MKKTMLKRIFAGMTSLAIMSTLAVGTSAAGLGATLSAPKIESYKSNESAIRINWSKVKGATGYRIYRYSGGSYKIVGTVKNVNTLTYKVTGLNEATKYTFKVRAYKKSDGNIIWSKSDKLSAATKGTNYSAYKKLLEKYAAKQSREESDYIHGYKILDINNDGVKELLIQVGTCEADRTCYVYTTKNGSAKSLGDFNMWHGSILYKNGKYYVRQVQAEIMSISNLTIKNGKVVNNYIERSNSVSEYDRLTKKYGKNYISFHDLYGYFFKN